MQQVFLKGNRDELVTAVTSDSLIETTTTCRTIHQLERVLCETRALGSFRSSW